MSFSGAKVYLSNAFCVLGTLLTIQLHPSNHPQYYRHAL